MSDTLRFSDVWNFFCQWPSIAEISVELAYFANYISMGERRTFVIDALSRIWQICDKNCSTRDPDFG